MMRTTIRLKEGGIRFAAIDLPGRRLFNQKWLASFGLPWRSIVKRFTAVWILLFLLLLLAFVPLVISEFRLFPVFSAGPIVNNVNFSPDGTKVVTASNDGTARLWEVGTGKRITVLTGHTSGVHTALFSPDGTKLVTASKDDTARLWDAATGKEIAVLTGHTSDVYSAMFSPDGMKVVTASKDHSARVWDVKTGKEIAVLTGHTSNVYSAMFSPDGMKVVTASEDKTARLWDTRTGKESAVLSGHRAKVISAAFSPDGQMVLTASWDKTARVWEARTGKEITTIIGHTNRVNSAAFSPDGKRVVTASLDGVTRLWDADTGMEINYFMYHTGCINFAAFSPTGWLVVTASDDRTARLWRNNTEKGWLFGGSPWPVAVLEGHKGNVISATFSPDGKLVATASRDCTARLWETESGRVLQILKHMTEGEWLAHRFLDSGLYYFLLWLTFGVTLILLDGIVIQNIIESGLASSGAKATWAMIVVMLPLLGIVLWFVLGRRRARPPAPRSLGNQ